MQVSCWAAELQSCAKWENEAHQIDVELEKGGEEEMGGESIKKKKKEKPGVTDSEGNWLVDWSCGDVPAKATEPRRGKRVRSGGNAQSEMKEGN